MNAAAKDAMAADTHAPFWRPRRCREMTAARVGEPVRRLRPLLPEQAEDEDTDATVFTDVGCKLLDGADLPLHRLRAPPGARCRTACG